MNLLLKAYTLEKKRNNHKTATTSATADEVGEEEVVCHRISLALHQVLHSYAKGDIHKEAGDTALPKIQKYKSPQNKEVKTTQLSYLPLSTQATRAQGKWDLSYADPWFPLGTSAPVPRTRYKTGNMKTAMYTQKKVYMLSFAPTHSPPKYPPTLPPTNKPTL